MLVLIYIGLGLGRVDVVWGVHGGWRGVRGWEL